MSDMKQPFFIIVQMGWTMHDTEQYMKEFALELYKEGIDVKFDKVRLEMYTDMVRCRFIPGRSFSQERYRYAGIRCDEAFGFDELDTIHFRKKGRRNIFKGSFMDYIRVMEQLRKVKREDAPEFLKKHFNIPVEYSEGVLNGTN